MSSAIFAEPEVEERQATRGGTNAGARGDPSELRQSPMMMRLLRALHEGRDVGHYGVFVFAVVARHFLPREDVVSLIANKPGETWQSAETFLTQIENANYSPPKGSVILDWQKKQDYQLILPGETGNVYRNMQFPQRVYDHIAKFYQDARVGG